MNKKTWVNKMRKMFLKLLLARLVVKIDYTRFDRDLSWRIDALHKRMEELE